MKTKKRRMLMPIEPINKDVPFNVWQKLNENYFELKNVLAAYDKVINALPTEQRLSFINSIPKEFAKLAFKYLENNFDIQY